MWLVGLLTALDVRGGFYDKASDKARKAGWIQRSVNLGLREFMGMVSLSRMTLKMMIEKVIVVHKYLHGMSEVGVIHSRTCRPARLGLLSVLSTSYACHHTVSGPKC